MTMLYRRLLLAAVLFPLVASWTPSAGQSVAQESDEDRRSRIADNLKLRFDELRDAQVEVTELSEADLPGFDEGTVIINGRNTLRFLVTRDDGSLYLLAADPVDVSMTKQEVAAEFKRLEGEELSVARQRHKELIALTRGMPSRGKDTAPVMIVEFSDFQCPYCARVVPTVEQVLAKYPEQVRLVFMHLPLSMHAWAESAAVAATCAARQSDEAFWTLHDFYLENQARVSPENVVEMSRKQLAQSEVNLEAWDACARDSDSVAHKEALSAVRSSVATATKFGATGTPAFFLNGRFLSGAQPLSVFDEMINEILDEDA